MLDELISSVISPTVIWIALAVLFVITIVLSGIFLWHWDKYSLRRSSAFLAKIFFFGVSGLLWIGLITLAIKYSSL